MSIQLASLISNYTHFAVGSLPFQDPDQAVDFIIERPWILPFWPELPRRAESERSLSRSVRALDTSWFGYEASEASGLFALRKKLERSDFRPALLKCHVLGPLTFLKHFQNPSSNFSQAVRPALEGCLKQIEWQMSFLSDFKLPLLFVLDEPELSRFNELSFVEKERLREAYTYLYVSVSERGGYLGVHNCGTFEIEALCLPFDLISFDAIGDAQLLEEAITTAEWSRAIERGLVVVPGVFPALRDKDFLETKLRGEALYAKWRKFVEEKSGPTNVLQARNTGLLCSANCGHANSSLEWVEELFGRQAKTLPQTA